MSEPLRFLLDTSVVISPSRARRPDLAEGVPAVSAVTVAELSFGLDVDDPVERRTRTDRFYALVDEIEILDFGLGSARAYGTLAALVRRAGRNPRPRRLDLMIAATAAHHGLPLVTLNPDDFRGLGAVVTVLPG